jgi:tetratricopeptide (TPR) repeat protein
MGSTTKAAEYAAKAIALDPKLVEAHEFLANLLLEDMQDRTRRCKEADTAIALSPYAGAGRVGCAGCDGGPRRRHVLADKNAEADAWLAKIKAVNPGYGEGYAIVARHLVLNRRYEDGVAYYRKAIEADPKDVGGAVGAGDQSDAAGRGG